MTESTNLTRDELARLWDTDKYRRADGLYFTRPLCTQAQLSRWQALVDGGTAPRDAFITAFSEPVSREFLAALDRHETANVALHAADRARIEAAAA